MESETKRRLGAIIRRKSAIDDEQASRLQAEEVASRARDEAQSATAASWLIASRQIDQAVATINKELTDGGLRLEVQSTDRDAPRALARLSITLWGRDEHGDRQVIFVVGKSGVVQPVFLIPYSGRSPANFQLKDARPDIYENILLDFLEQAIEARGQAKLFNEGLPGFPEEPFLL